MPKLITDDQIVEFTASLPGYYTPEEIRANLAIVKSLPWGAWIVELGVQFGRSASIYMQEYQRRYLSVGPSPGTPNVPLQLVFVDSWVVDGKDARPHFEQLLQQFSINRTAVIHSCRSDRAAAFIPDGIDFLHVDADHIDGIRDDCRLYLPKLVPGGWALFHDYAHESFPAVKEQVDLWTKKLELEDHGVVNTLAIRRRAL